MSLTECKNQSLVKPVCVCVCVCVCARARAHTRTRLVTQLCPALCNNMDCSPPGSSVLGILQARILEWVAMPSSRGSSQSRDRTGVCCISCIGRRHERCGFDPQIGKMPWRRAWQSTPVFLPAESHGQRNLVGYSPQGHKDSGTTEATQHTCTQPSNGKRGKEGKMNL